MCVFYAVYCAMVVDYYFDATADRHLVFEILFLLSKPNFITIATGFYLLVFLKMNYKREYDSNKGSILAFIGCEVVANGIQDTRTVTQFLSGHSEL